MNNSRFNIFEAVRNAYIFTGREWLYLLKAGFIPMMAQIVVSSIPLFGIKATSSIEDYLWNLPVTVLFAWFVFLEMRLLLLGERMNRLPPDDAWRADRRLAMQASVIVYLLFNMGITVATVSLMAATKSDQWGANWPLTLGGIFVMGGIVWGVRFGVAPILAAVHHPIRPVLRRTEGMMFSLRLIGMGIVCLFPLIFLFQVFLAAFTGKSADLVAAAPLTTMEQSVFIVLSAPVSLIAVTLLNASVAYALKQILSSRRDRGGT
ncbi:MAG: hypothetical protein V1721_04455 [Pseudomonadota bacterium]